MQQLSGQPCTAQNHQAEMSAVAPPSPLPLGEVSIEAHDQLTWLYSWGKTVPEVIRVQIFPECPPQVCQARASRLRTPLCASLGMSWSSACGQFLLVPLLLLSRHISAPFPRCWGPGDCWSGPLYTTAVLKPSPQRPSLPGTPTPCELRPVPSSITKGTPTWTNSYQSQKT